MKSFGILLSSLLVWSNVVSAAETARHTVRSLSGREITVNVELVVGSDENSEPAQFSLVSTARSCFRAEADGASYPMNPRYDAIAPPMGQPAVVMFLFVAEEVALGSGQRKLLTLLTPDDAGQAISLTPSILISEQSQYGFLWGEDSSGFPILNTADYIWLAEETHLGEHHYRIRTYRYDSAAGRYAEMFNYRTERKYPGLDDLDDLEVLDGELDVIRGRLRSVK